MAYWYKALIIVSLIAFMGIMVITSHPIWATIGLALMIIADLSPIQNDESRIRETGTDQSSRADDPVEP